LGGKPIYACQYKMAGKHWQIVDHRPDGSFRYGDFATLALKDVPKKVIEVATRAACLMGQGLYGVDLKETEKGVVVIEVNDNPNLDGGVEDKVLKDELYTQILKEFIRRIDGRS
jgi:glutathione synthase/RimK-type ligase-like ATP-grasp enzyme